MQSRSTDWHFGRPRLLLKACWLPSVSFTLSSERRAAREEPPTTAVAREPTAARSREYASAIRRRRGRLGCSGVAIANRKSHGVITRHGPAVLCLTGSVCCQRDCDGRAQSRIVCSRIREGCHPFGPQEVAATRRCPDPRAPGSGTNSPLGMAGTCIGAREGLHASGRSPRGTDRHSQIRPF